MSTGGCFKLIANDGKADRLIMATEFLNNRIKDIMCLRSKQGFADPTPTLMDIERTHILFCNAHFKPFAAHGFEYSKTRPQTGTAVFGGTTQFSIPQFGDFFSDMALHTVIAAASATAGTVPAFPPYIGDANQFNDATLSRSDDENAAAPLWTRYTYQYVTANGSVVNTGTAATNYVRYCEFPGERLCKNVRFEVNSNPLDSYYHESLIFHRKFSVPPNKITGWKRLVGQEVPIEGYSDLLSLQGSTRYGSAISNLQNVNGGAAAGSPVNAAESARKVVAIVNGPQTPKAQQPTLEMWIPLTKIRG